MHGFIDGGNLAEKLWAKMKKTGMRNPVLALATSINRPGTNKVR